MILISRRIWIYLYQILWFNALSILDFMVKRWINGRKVVLFFCSFIQSIYRTYDRSIGKINFFLLLHSVISSNIADALLVEWLGRYCASKMTWKIMMQKCKTLQNDYLRYHFQFFPSLTELSNEFHFLSLNKAVDDPLIHQTYYTQNIKKNVEDWYGM